MNIFDVTSTSISVTIKDVNVLIKRHRPKIYITLTKENANAGELLTMLLNMLKLYHLVAGFFPDIDNISILSEGNKIKELNQSEYTNIYLLLPTNKEYLNKQLILMDFSQAIKEIAHKFHEFERILDDLRIQMNLLYIAVSDRQMLIDVRSAFLIELFEPFTAYEKLIASRNPTLSESITNFILHYGQEVFKVEIDNQLNIIQRMVGTRVNIMHSKLINSQKNNTLLDSSFTSII